MTPEETLSAAMQQETLAAALRITAAENPAAVWVKDRAGENVITWGEGLERVDRIAGGLQALGLEKGDTVALMLVNRPEFHIVDFGVVIAGGTPFSIYQTYTADQIKYLLSDADTGIVVTEQLYLAAVEAACAELEKTPRIVLIDPPAEGTPDGTLSLSELEEMGAGFDGAAAASEIEPSDVLTLIYTSGTTGPPKGVQLSHQNLMSAVRSTS
ncbi:MAG: AMP-binding protein, partial [Actinobacteria bacterium]|nr:AMP-binding protein [Actinomycetota bacterium]